jgi:hypothetical protein
VSNQHAITGSTLAFEVGYKQGMIGQYKGDWRLPDHVDEETVVELIRNLCEISAEGWLSETLLRQDAGILVGWLASVLR